MRSISLVSASTESAPSPCDALPSASPPRYAAAAAMMLLRALLGLAFFCVVAWILSSDRRRLPWRVLGLGLALQAFLGWLILSTDVGRGLFDGATKLVTGVVDRARPGSELVFGVLGDPGGDFGMIFAFAGTGLPVIIFFSALMSVLYYVGIMQVLIWAMARVMSGLMGVSGAESMSMAANVFVGQTEAPLVVKPL